MSEPVKFELTPNVWTEITTDSERGTIFQQGGFFSVMYTSSATLPTTSVKDSKVIGRTSSENQDCYYFDIADGEKVYALAVGEGCVINVAEGK